MEGWEDEMIKERVGGAGGAGGVGGDEGDEGDEGMKGMRDEGMREMSMADENVLSPLALPDCFCLSTSLNLP